MKQYQYKDAHSDDIIVCCPYKRRAKQNHTYAQHTCMYAISSIVKSINANLYHYDCRTVTSNKDIITIDIHITQHATLDYFRLSHINETPDIIDFIFNEKTFDFEEIGLIKVNTRL